MPFTFKVKTEHSKDRRVARESVGDSERHRFFEGRSVALTLALNFSLEGV